MTPEKKKNLLNVVEAGWQATADVQKLDRQIAAEEEALDREIAARRKAVADLQALREVAVAGYHAGTVAQMRLVEAGVSGGDLELIRTAMESGEGGESAAEKIRERLTAA